MIDRPLLAKRLNKAYEYLRNKGVVHTISEFAQALGKTQSDISSALVARGRVMTVGLLERVADTFPEYLNRQYLVTGEGELANTSHSQRPHVSAKASAGFMDNLSEADYGDDTRPLIPGMPHYTFTINAKGDSMLPRIEDGDMLLCRKLTDRLNPPIGKICVLDTKDGWVVKVIKGVTEDTMTLHSLNPDYRDYDIDLNTILGIAQVVGLVREF